MLNEWCWENEETSRIASLYCKVQNIYHSIIPYNYRPSQLYYRAKCFLWNRYSTVKSRYLPHTWCDRDNLLFHTSMEILSQFLEKECSPGIVNWESDEYHAHAMSEMRTIYKWYHEEYMKKMNEGTLFWDDSLIPNPLDFSQPLPEGYKKMAHFSQLANEIVEAKKKEMLHRLIEVMPYMWT